MNNYGIFKKGRQFSVLAEPDAEDSFKLLALGYRRLHGHISAHDDAAALKCAAGISEDMDTITLALAAAGGRKIPT